VPYTKCGTTSSFIREGHRAATEARGRAAFRMVGWRFHQLSCQRLTLDDPLTLSPSTNPLIHAVIKPLDALPPPEFGHPYKGTLVVRTMGSTDEVRQICKGT
jgi:hypothetical protein